MKTSYQQKLAHVVAAFQRLKLKGDITLKPKATSHFFRKREKKQKLDLTMFNEVISIDAANLTADVESATTFWDIVQATWPLGLLPQITPELRNLTIGGTVSGLGIESSSFKYGLVHDMVEECDVLTADGNVLTCSRTENTDLFHALPNSLGSLGYLLRCKIKLIPAKKYTRVNLLRFDNAKDYFSELEKLADKAGIDFIDGIIGDAKHYVIITGEMTNVLSEKVRPKSLYSDVFWKLLLDRNINEFYLTTYDYIWRWDIDVYWCLHENFAWTEKPFFRKTLGKIFLRSDFIGKLRHKREQLAGLLTKIGLHKENTNTPHEGILQDLALDIKACTEFFEWYEKAVGVYPVWICPSKNLDVKKEVLLHQMPVKYLIDIGIYTGKERPENTSNNYYNRLLETKIMELKGTKGLYSQNFFTEDEFWSMYNKEKYMQIKQKYDPNRVFPDFYTKAMR